VHDGVEVVDLFHARFDEASHGGGAFDTFAVAALDGILGVVDGFAAGGEVGDEIGGELVRDELGDERGFGSFFSAAVSVGAS
jgi:hypothetical protein